MAEIFATMENMNFLLPTQTSRLIKFLHVDGKFWRMVVIDFENSLHFMMPQPIASMFDMSDKCLLAVGCPFDLRVNYHRRSPWLKMVRASKASINP